MRYSQSHCKPSNRDTAAIAPLLVRASNAGGCNDVLLVCNRMNEDLGRHPLVQKILSFGEYISRCLGRKLAGRLKSMLVAIRARPTTLQ